MGTFVQPNLTLTNNNNNPTITVVQTTTGFHKVAKDDIDTPMVVDNVKLQQQSSGIHLSTQVVESVEVLSSENHLTASVENNNRMIEVEDKNTLSPSTSPFIDINSLPMVFDDTKLFQNVSRAH